MRKLIVIAIASFGLASCGPMLAAAASTNAAQIPKTSDASTVALAKGTQALIDAHAVYTAAARLATQAVDAGIIRGPALERLRAYNHDALAALDKGYGTADGAIRLQQAGIVKNAAALIRTLTEGG